MHNSTPRTINKILIIRNDKLGDFVLSLPSFAMAKKALPDTEIIALVPSYTKQLAESFWAIDRVIIEPNKNATLLEKIKFLQKIRHERIEVSITLFSTVQTGWLLFFGNVTHRYAPATKIAQIFHNHKLKQRRSLSQKPEYEYNLDIVEFFLRDANKKLPPLPQPPTLDFDIDILDNIRQAFYQTLSLNTDSPLIFLHPNSGGSASNLSLPQYSELAQILAKHSNATIIITAGPGELAYATQLSKMLESTPHRVFESRKGLIDFSMHLKLAHLFISGSTGPLHIAGALNIPTVGFYPKHRSATPLRWQTLNSPERRLAFTPPGNSADQNMSAINIDLVSKEIINKLDQFLID